MAGVKGRSGGRNRKPRHMHLVDGTHRRDRHGDPKDAAPPSAAAGPAGEVVRPPWLTGPAGAVWDDLAPHLTKIGLLSVIDVPVFASLCITYAELQWSHKQRARWVRAGDGTPRLHAVVKYRRTLCDRLRHLAGEFGTTPASRARVTDLIYNPLAGGDKKPPPQPTGTDGKTVTDRLGRPL